MEILDKEMKNDDEIIFCKFCQLFRELIYEIDKLFRTGGKKRLAHII